MTTNVSTPARNAASVTAKQLRSVLIATDLSEASNQVIGVMYGLLPSRVRVELCTVFVGGAADVGGAVPFKSPLDDEKRVELESQLRRLIPLDLESARIVTNVSVIDSLFVAEAILAGAERLDVDLIAVASHGRSGLKRAVLGSVAEEVARRSERPVLIVPSQQRNV